MGRLSQLKPDRVSGGRLSQLGIETPTIPITSERPGFLKRRVSDIGAFIKGEVPVRDVLKEVPSITVKGAKGFANTFVPAITNFFKTTGSIFGEGLAYAVDKNVRKQYGAGNLDILPTITETTQTDIVKATIAAGIETAVYRSFPNIVKMKIAARGGAGALQGLGFAVSEGLANDKSPEEIVKSLPVYGVLGGTIGLITPYILPLLKAEMKAVPKEIKNMFKGLKAEVRPPKPISAEPELGRLPQPKEKLLLKEGIIPEPEAIPLSAQREKLMLKAGIKPTVEPTKAPIYKEAKINKNTQLEKGDIIKIEEVDKWVVSSVKKSRITPRGKEQILELKDIEGNVFEESVLDLIGATQIKKVGEKIIKPTQLPKAVLPKKVVEPAKKPEIIKPVVKEIEPIIITEKRITEVPSEALPVGEGKTVVSRLESRIKGTLDDVRPARADDAGITTFKQMNKADQIRKASEYVDKNADDAMAVLRGDKSPPEGLLHNSIMIALEEKAALASDANLALKLGSLRSSRAGQEISILTEADPSNPITKIAEIIKVRIERATRRLKKGQTVAGEKTRIQKEVSEVVNKEQLKISEAEKILSELVC